MYGNNSLNFEIMKNEIFHLSVKFFEFTENIKRKNKEILYYGFYFQFTETKLEFII